ncbi:hypothetical protein MTBPR1_100039 [Candidatus Terasakiella magnetica]|uniref:Uncharacterized protein n=1 Tax=Candidatus Terasakiella magnetica TaxID=1867952 RepID=A0A1C3RDT1_9PROT|nr:hypothetical protein [Candidatus Terasakiella magnetica]SCA55398.1 hypothetical protein MTBPR1_100039 [Candidatus Terasakiella magnetica]
MLVDSNHSNKNKQREQITQFIGSLKEKTEELNGWARHAEASLTGEGFGTYLEFRDLVIECESFNEIIQRRLTTDDKPSDNPDLQDQLDELSARQLTLAIHASLKFLRYIAEKNLPIGSRDVFIRELQDLHRMKKTLDNERLQGKVDQAALDDQRKVEEILNVVIEKAPQLFSFDNLDDEEEDLEFRV